MDDLFNSNPLFQSMEPAKLEFMKSFSQKAKPQNMKDAMPFLLANMNQAKKANIAFSNQEVRLIADILCKDLPETEKAKVQRIMSLMGR